LFLQESGHSFRPKFTILSHPGTDYVGGNDFFDGASNLVREFDIGEITALSPGAQPAPSMNIPTSLLRALDSFMIGATYKRKKEADQNCAFLCHVSTLKADHRHIVDLLREYKTKLAAGLKQKQPAMIARLKKAYDEGARGRDRNARRHSTPCIAQLLSGRSVSTGNSGCLFRDTFEFARRPGAYGFYSG
jgi:hypothetical protein